MDRLTVWPGQIPLETDLLNTNRNTMVGLAKLAAILLGSNTIVTGLPCTPTVVPSLAVLVGAGDIYAPENLEDSAYSSLPADTTHQILKQGISLDPVTLACAAPVTAGYSINYLIEASYQDLDTVPVVLPYYNAANPSQAFTGPGGNGAAQPTARKGTVSLRAKAGAAAATGTQTTPAADSGYVGLYVVTVAYGQTTVLAGNIAKFAGAPFLSSNLAQRSFAEDDGFTNQGAIQATRTTAGTLDAFYGEHQGTGTGYGFHGIAYSSFGSGIGGACWGQGAGVVGNKRGVGAGTDGNGVYGQCGIDGGNGSGVYGLFQGAGTGNAVGGLNQATGTGVALFGWRTSSGSGAALQALRDSSGDGQGGTIIRTGTGNGDGLNVECSTTGSGSGSTTTRKSGSTVWSIGYSGFYDGTQSIGLYGYAPAGGTIQWAGRFDGNVLVTGVTTLGGGAVSSTDGVGDLGSALKKFHTVFATTAAINTSDARLKTAIKPLTDAEIAAAVELAGEDGTFQYLDAVAEKGPDGARLHIGMTVQRAIEIMASHGLYAMSYAFICYDRWDEYVEPAVTEMRVVKDDEGKESTQSFEVTPARTVPAGDRYGFREAQLSRFVARGLKARQDAFERDTKARQDALDERLAKLEAAMGSKA